MSGPFSEGNREILSQAKANPITSKDQLIPSYWQQTAAAFNSAYYEVGIGIKREERKDLKDQIGKIYQLDIGEGDKNNLKNLYTMRFNGFSEESIDSKFTPEGKARLDNLLKSHSDSIADPIEVKRLNKQRITGEFQEAAKQLSLGDSLSAKLLGGVGGAFTSPVLLSSMFIPLGQEFAIARTGSTIAQILKAGSIEGGVGAAAELVNVGSQKRNAVFLGKDFNNWDAARNVALAGGAGFLFGSLLKSGTTAHAYIKELRQGVDDAVKVKIRRPFNAGENEAVRVMDDYAYTAERAITADEFKPLYGDNITNEQLITHMDNAKKAFDEAADWGVVAENKSYNEVLPKAAMDAPQRLSDDVLYKDYLTDSDRAFDAEIFAKADKVEVDLPVNIDKGEKGEVIISTGQSKEMLKTLDNELTGLEAVAMCMRGAK